MTDALKEFSKGNGVCERAVSQSGRSCRFSASAIVANDEEAVE
jgi:hypothetical protein